MWNFGRFMNLLALTKWKSWLVMAKANRYIQQYANTTDIPVNTYIHTHIHIHTCWFTLQRQTSFAISTVGAKLQSLSLWNTLVVTTNQVDTKLQQTERQKIVTLKWNATLMQAHFICVFVSRLFVCYSNLQSKSD